MTFRDYAQGTYRMRGIAKGQTIKLYIIPEVLKTLAKEVARGTGETLEARQLRLDCLAKGSREACSQLLRDVAAWLILNL